MNDGISAICDALQAVGVDCVFGLPGTQNVPLYEGFRRSGIRTVLTSHELAASFMANGYFRATGKIAALVTIPGPGFTFAITGIAEAHLDSVGLLYLVGKPAAHPGRKFQLQAIDQRTIAGPLVKACLALDRADDAAPVIREAHRLALEGEPGPVMVELDMAALSAETKSVPNYATVQPAAKPNPKLAQLTALFRKSERPLFLLGGGAFGAAGQLEQIARTLAIPIVTTPTARGIVAEDHPFVLGYDPLRGHTDELNRLIARSDLIVGLGCKLGHNGSDGFAIELPEDRFVHIDADEGVLGANYPAALMIQSRVEDAIGALVIERAAATWPADVIAATRSVLRSPPDGAAEPRIRGRSTTGPAEFFSWLRKLLPRDAIVVTDSGFHQIMTRRYFEVQSPRGLVFPSDLQSMGFGLPAAIGAKLAAPDRAVVALIGDGGFLMSGLELMTARRENIPLVTIVFNDGHLNQIRLQQWSAYGHTHAVDLLNPDFRALAEGLGVGYVRFGEEGDGEIERALSDSAPLLIEVEVGDSMAMRRVPAVARAKTLARSTMSVGLRNWLKGRLRRKRSH
ncbi:MAG: thiamine pyrophosphate-binding protein [bacterium]